MEKTGPRQNRQMRRHRILGDLATSGDVTSADRIRVNGNEPAKCRYTRVLCQRGQGLDGGTLIDESRHADEITETCGIHNKCRNLSTERIENLDLLGENPFILTEIVIDPSLNMSIIIDTFFRVPVFRKPK
jgi:hypothetical protein